jgi:sporulation protein YlmC with PRC-barrel domain
MVESCIPVYLVALGLSGTAALAQGTPAPEAHTGPAIPSTMPADPGTGLHQNAHTAAGVNKYLTRLERGMYRASAVIGREVSSSSNENVGEVDDLVIDRTGHLRAIVVAVGGILGLDERNIAVPMDRLALVRVPAVRQVKGLAQPVR